MILNPAQKELIQHIVKQSLLTCCMSISTFAFSTSLMVIGMVDSISVSFGYWSCSSAVIACCVYIPLTFGVNSGLYDKLCLLCHVKCEKECEALATKQILNKSKPLTISSNSVPSTPI